MAVFQLGVESVKVCLEKSFSRKIITAADCDDLAGDIYKKTDKRVSNSTLRRLFGLVKSHHKVSSNTLSIINDYCASGSNVTPFGESPFLPQANQTQTTGLVTYLTCILSTVGEENENGCTLQNFMHVTNDFLNQHPDVANQIQEPIAKVCSDSLNQFYHFVNIDKINSFYGYGLTHYAKNNKSIHVQFFAHSLLCLGSWLKIDCNQFSYHYGYLKRFDVPAGMGLDANSRFFAARLFYCDLFKVDTTQIITEARHYFIKYGESNKTCYNFFRFELVFAEALILTGHYSEALRYTSVGLRLNQNCTLSCMYIELRETFKLYHAIALYKTGRKKQSLELFYEIDQNCFYFLCKQFHCILYLKLAELLRVRRNVDEQINSIIHITKFSKLKFILHDDA